MVVRGQFLERPTVIPVGPTGPSSEIHLEALSHRGAEAPALLLLAPHPSRGGSMDGPVMAELAFAASQKGHPTLRFNYRGVGASQGEKGDLSACVEDAKAALSRVKENTDGMPVVVAGYDFGAEVAVELAKSGAELDGVVVIAPVKGGYDFSSLSKLPVRGLVAVGERDSSSDREGLTAACQQSGDDFIVIPAADHVFTRGLTDLGRVVTAFLRGERPEIEPRD